MNTMSVISVNGLENDKKKNTFKKKDLEKL